MRDIQSFWADVKEQELVIKRAVSEQPGATMQPSDGSVYITSVFSRDLGIKGGDVVLTTTRMAAQRIQESTHRLSTDAEIEQFSLAHARRRAELRVGPAPDGRKEFRVG